MTVSTHEFEVEFDGKYSQVLTSICVFNTCEFELMSTCRLLIIHVSRTQSCMILARNFPCHELLTLACNLVTEQYCILMTPSVWLKGWMQGPLWTISTAYIPPSRPPRSCERMKFSILGNNSDRKGGSKYQHWSAQLDYLHRLIPTICFSSSSIFQKRCAIMHVQSCQNCGN